ncbi:hypothetical protein [Bradyrhizobium sp. WD16]|uniref:hypothetical protein n=1 Tax=Bradyrhizobium sp. WD16 TaxID=1521768 RepID=UPI0020A32E82|nr:hypothetical protein [Bradyrhizobium sp. WD16]
MDLFRAAENDLSQRGRDDLPYLPRQGAQLNASATTALGKHRARHKQDAIDSLCLVKKESKVPDIRFYRLALLARLRAPFQRHR